MYEIEIYTQLALNEQLGQRILAVNEWPKNG